MTRAEQPTVVSPTSDALAADSRERAVRALLRIPPLRRLWSAQLVGNIGDALALLVLLLLSLQVAISEGSFGGGYRGAAFAVAAVFGARILATFLFGAVLLGPVSSLTAPSGPLDRRWTMIGADGLRLALFVVAPLWIDWTPDRAQALLLITVFVAGVAERFWTVCKEGAAPALVPGPPAEGAAIRPLPDHLDALRRLSLRTGFVALPAAGAVLLLATLIGNLLGTGIDWFSLHQAALGSYVAAGLFGASVSTLYFLELPGVQTPRARSPLEGLRRPKTGTGIDRGRTGAIPLTVLACAAVAGAVAAAAAVAVLHAIDLGGGPVAFALLFLALTGGTVIGIRKAEKVLPTLSRRRLLSLAIAVTGVALLAMGLVPDTSTVLFISVLAGFSAGVAANTGHTLIDQETEDFRRARTTEHLQAVVGVSMALGAVAAPLLAAAIGPQRLASGEFVFAHGGAAFTLMLIGALLLPVAAIVLAKTDDRQGVTLRRDLREALRGGDPDQAPAATGFFIAMEGGDGAGKSTQVEVLAEWIRNKGHEVVVTREPGATPIGKRLRSILLDVSSAGLSNRAEALLYAADRAEHVDSVVRPALERGAIVITDRYVDSSVAYQGAGRDLSPTEIARISRWATDGLVPHLTVLLDVSPETARERFTEAPDRLESEPPEFHARVRHGFLTLAAAAPARYLVVDAGQEPESVSTVVRHRLDQLLPLSEAEVKAQEEARKAAEEEARRKAEEEAARKAEEERLERERQEQLAKLRAEEEARKRREIEEARQREIERQAEEDRLRAEEARRLAEEERLRREAEAKARAAEQDRLRKQAEEEARLRAEAEERRREKQRRAEEALLRAEEARRLAEAAAAASAAAATASAAAEAAKAPAPRPTPAPAPAPAPRPAPAPTQAQAPDLSDSETTLTTPVVPMPAVRADDMTLTVPTPQLDLSKQDAAPAGGTSTDATPADRAPVDGAPADRTPAGKAPEGRASAESTHAENAPADRGRSGKAPSGKAPAGRTRPNKTSVAAAPFGNDETTVLPRVPDVSGAAGAPGAMDETAVLPPVRDGAPRSSGSSGSADETTVLPPVRETRPTDEPSDRVPRGFFRDEQDAPGAAQEGNDRTRELPQFDPEGGRPAPGPTPRTRRRSDWAEETPLDDLPSLADELLGDHDSDDEGDGRRGKGKGR
ncbi:dTMP kinase [Streptomyces sp. H27-C3]|uniref:dTMP kinase n=1 Tax=Streptomyces sp. H27-C3 TaxID=3046305 RepID=UPI0024BAA7CA|nr:dTMP kinase [Streptomyces sp. H27-C3]MDJ0461601.1 dTMP kinase [Streptomyces sp. H27-C3]